MATRAPFAPVERRTVADEIRERLVSSITAGDLPPGARLPSERTLCDEFGVARTSVREAIQGLVSVGLIERRGNRAYVVERLPEVRVGEDERRHRVRQLFETRRVIEGPVAELAACRADEAQRAELSRQAARFHPRLTIDEFRPLDRTFHATIAAACGNELLAELHGKVLDALFESDTFDSLLTAEENEAEVRRIIGESTQAHAAIAAAIADGDGAGAAEATRAHLDEVEARMLQRIS
jgi:GntR family transcriptional regulator, transcriptional repressor for pyruvate dehydrogenase complex